MKLRFAGRLAAAALLCCAGALPAAADGLSRFQAAIKDAPPGALTYKSAKSIGDNGFELDDVVVTPPPEAAGAKAQPVAIKRIVVDDFDFSALDKNVPPKVARLRLYGIEITDKPVDGVDLGKLAGIHKVDADFALDYRVDPDRKTATLKTLALDLKGLGRLDFSMVLDGVTPAVADNPGAAMNDATLHSASFVYADHSLLAKALPAAAKAEGMQPIAVVAMADGMLGAMRVGQGPATLAVLDALQSYIEDYQHPKGPLRITLDPPKKTTMAAVSAMKKPDEVIKALGLTVSYAGTRPHPTPAPEKPAKEK